MSVRMKFGESFPFPNAPGMWLRFVIANSPEAEGSIVITQGNVMLFKDDNIMLMESQQETLVKVVQEGDALCAKQGLLVSYTPIVGVGVTKRADPHVNDSAQ